MATIVALAAALRFYNLSGRSLWLDEIFQARWAHLNTFQEAIAQSNIEVNQMPLAYIVTWLLRPWGDGEFILRVPSVVEGTLAVLAAYLLGRALFGARVGLVASLLTAVFPFEVWYSQEARSYALFMLVTTAQMYSAYMAVKRGRVIDWLGLAIFTTLNLYTHYLAFFPTAAAAVYVGVFLLADLLKGASNRVKTATVSALIVIAVAGAYTPWRPLLREARLHVALAVGTAVVALALVTLATFLIRDKLRTVLRSNPTASRQLMLALAASVLVTAAYIPWLPQLRIFLDRPDASIARLRVDQTPCAGDLICVLGNLGLSGFLLAAFCVSLGIVIVRMFRGSAAESSLLIAWLGISLLLLLRTAGSSLLAIDVRYLAFLVPAAMIVMAAGVDGAARGFEWAVQRGRRAGWPSIPHPATAASVVLVACILLQLLPALAASYQAPKDDWRSTAEHIAAASPPGSWVFAVGDYSDWSVLCLPYYFQHLRAPVHVIDGRFVNSDVAAKLAAASGAVWGVVIYPSSMQSALLSQSSVEQSDFVDVTGHIHVVRASDPSLSAIEQARALLRWEAQVQPQAGAL